MISFFKNKRMINL